MAVINESAWLLTDTVKMERNSRESLDDTLRPLFKEVSDGDREILGSIYDLCAAHLFGLALWQTGSQADAADVVQEVFLKIASRSEHLHSIRFPYRYLLRITHSASCDLWRKKKREFPMQDILVEPAYDSDVTEEETSTLSQYLQELPPAQREALYLRYYADLPLREIAKICGVSLFTAASRCRLGIARLKKRFGEK